jgi:hypothetical protein
MSGAKTIAKLIRRLTSDSNEEVLATVGALKRLLESRGSDLHDLANSIEKFDDDDAGKGGLTDEDVQAIFLHGYTQGAEQERKKKQQGSGFGFASTDEVSWQEAALFAEQNLSRLRYDGERAFIEDMAIQARHSPHHSPSEKQLAWLFKIHRKLGGRST